MKFNSYNVKFYHLDDPNKTHLLWVLELERERERALARGARGAGMYSLRDAKGLSMWVLKSGPSAFLLYYNTSAMR